MKLITAGLALMAIWVAFILVTYTQYDLKPVACIEDNEMLYLADYRIEKNFIVDNTTRRAYTDCYFYDKKMADKIKASMARP